MELAPYSKNHEIRLRTARAEEYESVRDFYWEVIDLMQGRSDTVGWKKGIYPADDFLRKSIVNGELYVLDGENGYTACVILNSAWNEGYEGCPWSVECGQDEVLVPHALAVYPKVQGRGIGKAVVQDIIETAKTKGMKCIRLDVLRGNTAAERLYTGMGFQFVQAKEMFYEDTGWAEFMMFELAL